MARFFWHPLVRISLFWMLVCASIWLGTMFVPYFDLREIAQGAKAARLDLAALSKPEFAYAIATGIIVFASGLALAFALLHALAICVSLSVVRHRISGAKSMVDFTKAYGSIYRKLGEHPLLGHAWKEFNETLVIPDDDAQPIRNTVRPQAFINIGVLREKLFGLKMLNSIPGYFVGLGLLLTFTGLVLALHNAADAVNSSGAEGMQLATKKLLQTATFKFSTSIAGLGASIALSLLFRIYTIYIEGSLDKVCHALERNLRYTAPQSITAEMNERLGQQVVELKQINSADFFSRMGEQLSPQIHSAFTSAIAPMNTSINAAVDRLSANSQSGVSELLKEFTSSIHGPAGAEIHELAKTLLGIREALSDVGEHLRQSSVSSRDALADVMLALQGTFEQANQAVRNSLEQTTTSASERIEQMLNATFSRLDSQVSEFQHSVIQYQTGMSSHLDATNQKVAESRATAVEAIGAASAQAAHALQSGLAGALKEINGEIGRLISAMRETSNSIVTQSGALRDTIEKSRAVAEAFGRTAQDVRVAAAPLVQSSDRIAGATERLSESFRLSVSTLEAGQTSGRQLAEGLQAHAAQMSEAWTNFSKRFEGVDEELSRAFEKIHDATVKQGNTLFEYSSKIDSGLASAIDKLRPALNGLHDDATDLAEAVERLSHILKQPA